MPVRNYTCQELYITVNTLNVHVHVIVQAVPVQAFVYDIAVNILCIYIYVIAYIMPVRNCLFALLVNNL